MSEHFWLSSSLRARTLSEVLGLQAGPPGMKFLLLFKETVGAKQCLVDRAPKHIMSINFHGPSQLYQFAGEKKLIMLIMTKVAVMLRREGGGPLSKLLSGGDTSTNVSSNSKFVGIRLGRRRRKKVVERDREVLEEEEVLDARWWRGGEEVRTWSGNHNLISTWSKLLLVVRNFYMWC